MTQPVATKRQQQRRDMMADIVRAARELVPVPGGLSLRAVAQRLGITAPALYRYVSNVQDLTELVAFDIESEIAAAVASARDRHPPEDPAAQVVAASLAFRHWALGHPAEFAVAFANPVTGCERDDLEGSPLAEVFGDIIVRVWQRYDFELPDPAGLDPAVREAAADPDGVISFPPDLRHLIWPFMRAWTSLYGTVTLEVFGHLPAQVIESGALFRAMLEDQAVRFALTEELPRLRPMIDEELSQTGS